MDKEMNFRARLKIVNPDKAGPLYSSFGLTDRERGVVQAKLDELFKTGSLARIADGLWNDTELSHEQAVFGLLIAGIIHEKRCRSGALVQVPFGIANLAEAGRKALGMK